MSQNDPFAGVASAPADSDPFAGVASAPVDGAVQVIDPATGQLASKTITVKGKRGQFKTQADLDAALAAQAVKDGKIDPLKFAAERSAGVLAQQNPKEQLQQLLFPTASGMLETKAAGLSDANFGNYAAAIGRDFLNLPGRGFRAAAEMIPAAWVTVRGKEGYHSEVGPDGREIAVQDAPGSAWGRVSQGFADPTGVFGDPMLAPMMAAPMLAPEAIGTRVAALGLPRLGRVLQAYPRAAGFLTYPMQGIGQGIGASALSAGAERAISPSASDATAPAQASIIPSEAVTPLQLGLGAAGGMTGAFGNWLSHAGLEAVPGAAQLADLAQKTRRLGYAPTRAEKMAQIEGLLDRSGALSERGLTSYSMAQSGLGHALTEPIVSELSPKTVAFQDQLQSLARGGTGEQISGTVRRTEDGGRELFGIPRRQEEIINRQGGLGGTLAEDAPGTFSAAAVENPFTLQDLREEMLDRAFLAKRNGNKAFRGVSDEDLVKKVDKAIGSLAPLSQDGFALSEVPGMLGELNNLAYDRYISTGRQSAKELGKLGRSVLAPKYWENAAFNPIQTSEMAQARRAFGEAKGVDELLNEAATGGMKRRGDNIVSRLGALSGFDFAVPLMARKFGKEITRRSMLGERILHERNK